MISNGLQNEARKVILKKERKPLQTIGYKEFFDFFEKKQSLEKTISLIKQNTRRYAKRQITWFKGKKYIEIDVSETKKIEKIIKKRED